MAPFFGGGSFFCLKARRLRRPPRRSRSPLLPTRAKRSRTWAPSKRIRLRRGPETLKKGKQVVEKAEKMGEGRKRGRPRSRPLRGPDFLPFGPDFRAPPGPGFPARAGFPGPSARISGPSGPFPALRPPPAEFNLFLCYVFIVCILLQLLYYFVLFVGGPFRSRSQPRLYLHFYPY